jgi:UDP-N-acetylmuramate--alanine ligase
VTERSEIDLAGAQRRADAFLVKQALLKITDFSENEINTVLSSFPGTARRFEELAPNLYSDYAHHPAEIAATIAAARELNQNVIAVYEPHQNTRQLQLIDDYRDVFDGVKHLYWLPTFLPPGDREKSSQILQPNDFIKTLRGVSAEPAEIDDALWQNIEVRLAAGDLVLAMSAGDLDAWLRGKIS